VNSAWASVEEDFYSAYIKLKVQPWCRFKAKWNGFFSSEVREM
jgi:hypothetical protein